MKKRVLLFVALTMVATLALACGGGTKATPTGTSAPPTDIPPATPTTETMAPTSTPQMSDVERGQQLAQDNGCTSCHSTDGSSGVGPTWSQVYGTSREIEPEGVVVVDDEYIRESIREPSAVIAKGFGNFMPAFTFSDADIDAIAAYIASLQ